MTQPYAAFQRDFQRHRSGVRKVTVRRSSPRTFARRLTRFGRAVGPAIPCQVAFGCRSHAPKIHPASCPSHRATRAGIYLSDVLEGLPVIVMWQLPVALAAWVLLRFAFTARPLPPPARAFALEMQTPAPPAG